MMAAKWEPNENQLKALEYARENQYVYQVKKLSELLGINRQAIYDWNRCDAFNTWWNRHRNEFFAARLDQVHGMVYARAVGVSKAGSMHDSKLFLERFDKAYQPRQRTELTGAEGGPMKTYVFHNITEAEITGEVDTREPRAEAEEEEDAE